MNEGDTPRAYSIETDSPVTQELEPRATTPRPSTAENSNHFQDLVKSVRNVVNEPSRQPNFLGSGSGITLARMVLSTIRLDALPSTLFSERGLRGSKAPALATEVSLPPRQAADHLVEIYFQYRTPHFPIMERSQVEAAVEIAYSSTESREQISDHKTEKAIFTTYMILAIALCDVPSPSGGSGRPNQAEGCFQSAIACIEKVIVYSKTELETLRTILLLAQFVALCPSRGSLWHLAGIALRLCVDIGLHWETEEQSVTMDPSELHERRRLFYSTYQFDRVLCINLGRPFGIVDESLSVPLPNPWTNRRSLGRPPKEFDVHGSRAHNHLFIISKLQSEIRHVQHSQSWATKVAYPRPNYSAWVHDIQPRLQEWYDTIPNPAKAHPSSIFANQAYWDSLYHNAVLELFRPNSTVLNPSVEALFISYDSACKLIGSIKVLQREGKIDVMWKSVHQLFMAGLAVIYSLWQSKEVREQNPVKNSISALQSCESTLSAMSQTFPGASGCRDVFEALSSATVDWLVTKDAEELRQNQQEFEKQVEDLMAQFQPSNMFITNDNGANNMSSMLLTDNFAFSEMLSSAAQWPEFPNNFEMPHETLNSAMDTGVYSYI